MFWDRISGVYDLFETAYNGTVYQRLGIEIAAEIEASDLVLECACGTGAISRYIAPKCRQLIATDLSDGMLKQAAKKCRKYAHVRLEQADLTKLDYPDSRFDKVVAGNVIHLLEDPAAAVKELERVCRKGGKLILPTYINASGGVNQKAVRFLEWLGADFKRQFDLESYRQFFRSMGYSNMTVRVLSGRMPCAVAVI